MTIPDSVTSIGNYAFRDCTGLTSVTIPDSVTSIVGWAFYGCTGLTSVKITDLESWCKISFSSSYSNPLYYAHNLYLNDELVTDLIIPAGVTSIGDCAFEGCTGLTSVTIGNGVTSIGGSAFSGCTGLTSVTIGNSVTSIGGSAFYNCTGLTSLTIPDSVTSIGGSAFSGCTGLTSVTIGNSVTSIGGSAFYNCTGLTSVTIPDSVTSIGGSAFSGCTGLTRVKITDLESWCKISFSHYSSNPLYYAHNLYLNDELVTDLTIPAGVTSIGDYAFYRCTGLTSVTIPDSVTSIGLGAFYGCAGLTSVTIPDSVTSIGLGAFYSCTGLTSVIIPDSVTSIGGSAFYNCTGLTSVTIPNNVTSIGNSAFYSCTGLTSVTIPDSVTSIGDYAFNNVANIAYNGSVSGSPWGARSVNGYVEYPLVYSDSKKTDLLACPSSYNGEITIPDSVTSIGDYAFYKCTGLTSVTIPDSVTSIGGYAFRGCTDLTSMTLPFVGASKTATGYQGVFGYIFGYESSSTTGTLRQFYSSNSSYYYYIPSSLREITITDATQLSYGAFYNCSFLTSITIPNSVMSIGNNALYSVPVVFYSGYASGSPWGAGTIHKYYEGPLAFSSSDKSEIVYCQKYASKVTISGRVTNIADYSFNGCDKLTDVYYSGTQSDWDDIVIGSNNDALFDAALHTHSHVYTLSFKREPTCSETGLKKYTCSVCGDTYTEKISRLPHTPISVTVPASCAETGAQYTACEVCGAKLSEDTVLPALGHSYDEGVVTKEPSCTEEGIKTFTCSVCGDTYTESIDKVPHTSETVTVSATCTESGLQYDVCGICGAKLSEDTVLPALGHHFDEGVITKQPTCTEEGIRTLSCTRCDYSCTEPMEMIEHTLSDWVVLRQPSCTTEGLRVRLCSVCVQMVVTETMPITHQIAEWEVTTPPTCTESGEETGICTLCGVSDTRPVAALGHSFGDWSVTTAPTCTELGEETRVCTVCHAVNETRSVAALGHSFGDWSVTTAPTCTEPGEEKRTCSVCKAEETRVAAALGHDYVDTVTSPACTEQGFTTHVCSRCRDSYVTDYTPAKGHTWSEWIMMIDPTPTTNGTMCRFCVDCGITLDTMTVPKLVDNRVTGITLSSSKEYISLDATLTLSAQVLPETAMNKIVLWTSSEPDVATVENGVVTPVAPGITVIVAQTADCGYKDFCVVQVNAVTPQNGSVIDNGVIYGLTPNLNSLDDYLSLEDDALTFEYSSDVIGTGTKVLVKQGETIVNEFSAVIFGDVNGDGFYDGYDAFLVSCIISGALNAENFSAAKQMAADCNHDGRIDKKDVKILEKAGLLLEDVVQTETHEELIETNSAYVEYLSLIDQAPQTEDDRTEQVAAERGAKLIDKLLAFIRSIFDFIRRLFIRLPA